MIVNVREDVCTSCPWRKENAHQLQIDKIIEMIDEEIISPCHKIMEKITGSPYKGVEVYAEYCSKNNKPFIICRGFAIARARLYRNHNNKLLNVIDEKVRNSDDFNREDIVDMEYIYNKAKELKNR